MTTVAGKTIRSLPQAMSPLPAPTAPASLPSAEPKGSSPKYRSMPAPPSASRGKMGVIRSALRRLSMRAETVNTRFPSPVALLYPIPAQSRSPSFPPRPSLPAPISTPLLPIPPSPRLWPTLSVPIIPLSPPPSTPQMTAASLLPRRSLAPPGITLSPLPTPMAQPTLVWVVPRPQ